MQTRKRIRKAPVRNRTEQNIHTIRKITKQSEPFFKRPIARTMTKTIMISGALFGVLYISKYFFSTTAKMITSFKEVRNACRE
ncbi:hypothetical protein AWE51_08750 [Aquimarina aggregata]|uniref:Uncharacterized protein n=1 Tax=Aquimarina aggregata TaxID=1642818 RepID=A0A162ZDK7_9FLAO|nr:hypothetical protein [Aquimarina aggregata]KZS39730.1 hypothetical protein AWE51_08750 [Aquimarina aggregata]